MSEKIAKFRLKNYIILNSNISIQEGHNIDKSLDIEFADSHLENEKDLIFELKLKTKIKDKNNSLNIEVLIKGIFEFDKEITEKERDIFFNSSAPAILFPYVRAYISSLTGLSGINPIILPTINLSKK